MIEKDRILKILEETHTARGSKIPFYLIQRAYEAERAFIFEKDRAKPLEMLKQIAEEYADSDSSK